jgi:predicted Rossmann fold flavoprotein|tara:strand:- start:125 stop:1327 length:1203 start_codon:yes stop_codon:yes gene_type:complete
MKIAIIGGGAAGFFAALSAKENYSNAEVIIYEKSDKILSKVKISGGGRCNVTHSCFKVRDLVTFYPRGGKQLKKIFGIFNPNHTVAWFKDRGVDLKTEADNRMFPDTNKSMTIINCLLDEAHRLGVVIKRQTVVQELRPELDHIILKIDEFDHAFDKVIVATGGSPKASGFKWLKQLGHEIIDPIPSLFTFNMPDEKIINLQGVVSKNAIVRVQGSKLYQEGPLLVTHWGMSGPAILKTSAWEARNLAEKKYAFNIQVNWIGNTNEEEVRILLNRSFYNYGKKKVINVIPFDLPNSLWKFLLEISEIDENIVAGEVSKKLKNVLINNILNSVYSVNGKTTFKEEFVTCGGIALKDVNMKTMESKVVPNLFFAGEVLNIDGVTGGFNFQAAWTTGYIAGKN